MSCTELPRADTAARPEAGALLPPPNFPAGGFGDTRRRPLPFAAPTRAHLPAHEAAETPPGPGPARDRALPDHPDRASPTRAAVSPAGRGAPLAEPADDIAALIAVALFIGAVVVILAGLTGD